MRHFVMGKFATLEDLLEAKCEYLERALISVIDNKCPPEMQNHECYAEHDCPTCWKEWRKK